MTASGASAARRYRTDHFQLVLWSCAGAEADVRSADRQRKPGNESRPAPSKPGSHEASRSMSAVDAVLGDKPQDLGNLQALNALYKRALQSML